MPNYATLHTHTDAGIHTILLNRPEKRNALNHQLIADLTHALESFAASQTCRVLIITGAGSAFCAGLDLEHLRAMIQHSGEASATEDYLEDAQRIATLLRTLCDFTLAVPEAKFGYTEVRIGFIPAVVSAFLYTQIGQKASRDLLLTGRLLSATEAHNLGLVNRIVPEPELLSEAKLLAQRLLRNSPAAMESTKRLLGRFSDHHLPDDIEAAIRASVDARSSADFQEGVTAFLEKRDPLWPSAHNSANPSTSTK
jgi:methylglutaconyl-CoA hydratase